MSEKRNGVHGQSLFIDGFEVLRVVDDADGNKRIALGAALGTAIEYLDDPAKLVAARGELRKAMSVQWAPEEVDVLRKWTQRPIVSLKQSAHES